MLRASGHPKETVTAIMMIYTKHESQGSDGDTDFFDIVTGVLQGDTESLNIQGGTIKLSP